MTPQQGGQGGGMFSTLIMFGLIIVIFYFMILRPQQKRQKEREKMLGDIQKGDKIITAGGVHGTVAGLEDKTILLQIAENVKVKIEKSAVSSVTRSTGDNVGKTS
ncbi:MAG: preprotein translocase subunit YajC [Ignavibacteriales bacterium]|nr:preprotein translocase subunit YajC [Ignavibacteriales bacterium]